MAQHTTEGCSVEWADTLGAVVVDCAAADSDAFRASVESAVDRLADHEAEKLLVETRGDGHAVTADCEWLRGDPLSRAEAAGLRALALVCAPAAVEDAAAALLSENHGSDRNVFENGDAARVWLLDQ